mmetsp:Transcript_14423/g.58852  ORF Transcript_14423/g.58852 Transcript_14423/m.58852 type:complete len:102 (-) Transcript_14423:3495-3800(-)
MPLFRSVDPRGHSACLRASRDAKGLLPSLRFPPRRLRRTLRITSAANAANSASATHAAGPPPERSKSPESIDGVAGSNPPWRVTRDGVLLFASSKGPASAS